MISVWFLLFALVSFASARRHENWCGNHQHKPMLKGSDFCTENSRLQCDSPVGRDKHVIRSTSQLYIFQLVWNVVGRCGSTCKADIQDQLYLLNETYAPARIAFSPLLIRTIQSKYERIPFDWSDVSAEEEFKNATSYRESRMINIWVFPELSDNLLGYATFPWNPTANSKIGGIVVLAEAVNRNGYTMVHEMGHQLGLLHTFQSSPYPGKEDPGCNTCSEPANSQSNLKGDLCADTPATTINFECDDPDTEDCRDVTYKNTLYRNYMSYSDDDCMSESRGFTRQQIARMRCWANEKLKGVFKAVNYGQQIPKKLMKHKEAAIANNTSCQSAMVVPSSPIKIHLDNTKAANVTFRCYGIQSTQSGFWFTLPNSTLFEFNTCLPGLTEDVVMAFFEGTCNNLRCRGISYGGDFDCTTIKANSTQGQYVFVGSSVVGDWDLEITQIK